MNVFYKISVLFIFLAVLSGCATTKSFSSIENLDENNTQSINKIAIMPVDVTLSILTAGGMLEPQAEWTNIAVENINKSLEKIDSGRVSDFVEYKKPEENSSIYKTIYEYEKLHRAVGHAILFNKLQYPLPTKKDLFDWTLGKGTNVIKDYTDANYALFIYLNDSYSSGGRILLQVAAALLGVGVSGGQQAGFATLVDLSSGDVVWFNFLHSTAGDLREEDSSLKTVKLLLDKLPD